PGRKVCSLLRCDSGALVNHGSEAKKVLREICHPPAIKREPTRVTRRLIREANHARQSDREDLCREALRAWEMAERSSNVHLGSSAQGQEPRLRLREPVDYGGAGVVGNGDFEARAL